MARMVDAKQIVYVDCNRGLFGDVKEQGPGRLSCLSGFSECKGWINCLMR